MQPIIGYNYGAKHYERLRETNSLGLRLVTVISVVIFLIMMIFPQSLMKIFTGDPLTIETGAYAMRVMFALAILIGVQIVSGGLYQAFGMPKLALILSMACQVLFLIPLVLILPHFFGVTGVWLVFPLSDFKNGSGKQTRFFTFSTCFSQLCLSPSYKGYIKIVRL